MNQGSVDFETTLQLVKSVSEDGRWIIKGVAVGPTPDLQGDVITEEAIVALAEQINTTYIPLRDWHKVDSVLEDMGHLVKATIMPDFRLEVEAELDQDHPGAQYVWRKLDQGKQYGLSVKGKSNQFWYDFDKSSGARVRKHKLVILDEMSMTTKPVFTPSLGTVLKKAVDSLSSPAGDKMEITSPDTGAEVSSTENQEQQSATPATNAVTETVIEKAVSAETRRDAQKLAKLVRLNREITELIAELGLDESESADSNDNVVVAKSVETETTANADSTPDVASLVKSVIEETTAELKAEIAALKSVIPATTVPAVLTKSEETVDPQSVVAGLRGDPWNALRLGLAARHGELDKIVKR